MRGRGPRLTSSAEIEKARFKLAEYGNRGNITSAHLDTHRRITEKLVKAGVSFEPRLWQSAVAHDLAHGKDVVLKAGTGSGKTLAFQAVALLKPTRCVLVISPLIALMADQKARAEQLGIKAICLTSEAIRQNPHIIQDTAAGKFQMVYITAEFTKLGSDKWKEVIGTGFLISH